MHYQSITKGGHKTVKTIIYNTKIYLVFNNICIIIYTSESVFILSAAHGVSGTSGDSFQQKLKEKAEMAKAKARAQAEPWPGWSRPGHITINNINNHLLVVVGATCDWWVE